MTTEEADLTFIRCPSCRSLIPAIATRCRMCGTQFDRKDREGFEENPAAEATDPHKKSRVRQRTITATPEEVEDVKRTALAESSGRVDAPQPGAGGSSGSAPFRLGGSGASVAPGSTERHSPLSFGRPAPSEAEDTHLAAPISSVDSSSSQIEEDEEDWGDEDEEHGSDSEMGDSDDGEASGVDDMLSARGEVKRKRRRRRKKRGQNPVPPAEGLDRSVPPQRPNEQYAEADQSAADESSSHESEIDQRSEVRSDFGGRGAPRPETSRVDSPRPDSSRRDNQRVDSQRTENPRTENPRSENQRTENQRSENQRHETQRHETQRQESSRHDNPRFENQRSQNQRDDNQRDENPRHEQSRHESSRQDSPRQDSPRQENPRQQQQPRPESRNDPRQQEERSYESRPTSSPVAEPVRVDPVRSEPVRAEAVGNGVATAARPVAGFARPQAQLEPHVEPPAVESTGELVGWLADFSTDKRGFGIELRAGKFFIGRQSLRPNDLVLDQNGISTPHCMVTASTAAGLHVQDLMSEKGTCYKKVGEREYKPLHQAVLLGHGDWLKLGDYEVMICLVPSSSR